MDNKAGINNRAGVKDDQAKPDMDLVLGGFARALLEVSKVGTFGAKKYTADGWKTVPDAKARYLSAAWRHYVDYKYISPDDPESSLHHLAHMAWNSLAALHFALEEAEVKASTPKQRKADKKVEVVDEIKYPDALNMEAQLLKAFLGL